MADSQKLDVLKALTTFLEPVEVLKDGALVAMTGRWFRGRAIFGEDDPIPMGSILEAPQGSFSTYGGDQAARRDTWLLLLQGWCDEDPENPADPVYAMLDEVEKRLYLIMAEGSNGYPIDPVNYRLGNRIANIQYGPGVVRPPVAGVVSKAFFHLPLVVTLASDDR